MKVAILAAVGFAIIALLASSVYQNYVLVNRQDNVNGADHMIFPAAPIACVEPVQPDSTIGKLIAQASSQHRVDAWSSAGFQIVAIGAIRVGQIERGSVLSASYSMMVLTRLPQGM